MHVYWVNPSGISSSSGCRERCRFKERRCRGAGPGPGPGAWPGPAEGAAVPLAGTMEGAAVTGAVAASSTRTEQTSTTLLSLSGFRASALS